MPPLRREDEGYRFPDRVCGRRPDHPSPGVDVRGGEAVSHPRFRAGRPAGGRGEWGVRITAVLEGKEVYPGFGALAAVRTDNASSGTPDLRILIP
jgi:hypothetical protein